VDAVHDLYDLAGLLHLPGSFGLGQSLVVELEEKTFLNWAHVLWFGLYHTPAVHTSGK
jgi:hypothetical protein